MSTTQTNKTTRYRMFLAELGSRKEIAKDGYHYQVFASSLAELWEKSKEMRDKGNVYVSAYGRNKRARDITEIPSRVGLSRFYTLYVQRVQR